MNPQLARCGSPSPGARRRSVAAHHFWPSRSERNCESGPECGETLQQGAARETFEETGVRIDPNLEAAFLSEGEVPEGDFAWRGLLGPVPGQFFAELRSRDFSLNLITVVPARVLASRYATTKSGETSCGHPDPLLQGIGDVQVDRTRRSRIPVCGRKRGAVMLVRTW
jgi:8-oxo-dGTP pyrophosphatase MutT (NUDIX family)